MRFRLAALTAALGYFGFAVYDCAAGDFRCAGHAVFGCLSALVVYAEAGSKKLPTK